MRELMDFDVARIRDWWEQIARFVEQADLCSFSFALLLLLTIGAKAVEQRNRARRWGVRLCFVAFVGWLYRGLSQDGLAQAEDLLRLTIRGLALAAATLAAAWIILPIIETLCYGFILLPLRILHRHWRNWWSQLRTRQHALRQSLHDTQDQMVDLERSIEQEIDAERDEQERMRRASEQRRRDEIRLDLQLLYDRYRLPLKDVLTPEHVEAYFQTFLTDELTPDVFAQRAEKLMNMIRDLLQLRDDQETPAFSAIEEVMAFYEERKDRLRRMPVDTDTTETLLIDIEDQQRQAMHEFLKRRLSES